MVKVVMRIDNEADRLVARHFFSLLQGRYGAAVVERAFHHHEVVFHFNGYAVVRATR